MRVRFFQLLIIIGSIANAGVQSFSDTSQPLKSIIISLTMLVAICAGITGYYKSRERSFNLQQTADSIEEHAHAFLDPARGHEPHGPVVAERPDSS